MNVAPAAPNGNEPNTPRIIDECVRYQRTAISYDLLLCDDCATGEIDGTVIDEREENDDA